MRWGFTWIGGLLRAGERRECVMPPSVEGLPENRTEEGTWEFTWIGGQGRREKRLQRASVGGGRS